MFSVLVKILAVLGFAVAARVGVYGELSIFPCFGWFRVFFFAVRTLNHNNHRFYLVSVGLKRFNFAEGNRFPLGEEMFFNNIFKSFG